MLLGTTEDALRLKFSVLSVVTFHCAQLHALHCGTLKLTFDIRFTTGNTCGCEHLILFVVGFSSQTYSERDLQ